METTATDGRYDGANTLNTGKMIRIENLKYKYQGASRYVFDGFNLDLEGNNIYGLLGKNGTGKSTLLYLISGLLRPTAGRITVGGIDSAAHDAGMLAYP